MRKFFLGAGKTMSSLKKAGLVGPKATEEVTTPESKKIKANINMQLQNLHQKLDKKSLAQRRLLLETKGHQQEPQQSSLYTRTKKNPSTLAAVKYMKGQLVFLPCKRSVLKNGMQKKSHTKKNEEAAPGLPGSQQRAETVAVLNL